MLFAEQVMKISYPPVVQRVITTYFPYHSKERYNYFIRHALKFNNTTYTTLFIDFIMQDKNMIFFFQFQTNRKWSNELLTVDVVNPSLYVVFQQNHSFAT